MGNTVVWKPASSRDPERLLHHEAARGGGAAAGRHQLRARRRGGDRRRRCSTHRDLAGIHFTGSHRGLQRDVEDASARTSPATAPTRASSARPAARTSSSRTPRADPQALAVALVRGAFEYQGQKCSAASRVYVPRSLWRDVARPRGGDDRRDRRWATSRLPQLHGRGDRREGVRRDHRLHRRTRAHERHDPGRRRRRTATTGYFIEPTLVRDRGPRLPADVRGDLRAGA